MPITPNLRAVLEMRRTDPAGNEHGPDAFVFGNDVGERVGRVKRAWETTVLKAHGHKATYVKGTTRLSTESRGLLQTIDLNSQDLRREAGSRMLEAGVREHIVQGMLGQQPAEKSIQ